jgi:hypothetical protein
MGDPVLAGGRFQLKPHPDFPVGCAVRVKPVGKSARPAKHRLVGRVGTVKKSGKELVLVFFPGERVGEFFPPRLLERAGGGPAAA